MHSKIANLAFQHSKKRLLLAYSSGIFSIVSVSTAIVKPILNMGLFFYFYTYFYLLLCLFLFRLFCIKLVGLAGYNQKECSVHRTFLNLSKINRKKICQKSIIKSFKYLQKNRPNCNKYKKRASKVQKNLCFFKKAENLLTKY